MIYKLLFLILAILPMMSVFASDENVIDSTMKEGCYAGRLPKQIKNLQAVKQFIDKNSVQIEKTFVDKNLIGPAQFAKKRLLTQLIPYINCNNGLITESVLYDTFLEIVKDYVSIIVKLQKIDKKLTALQLQEVPNSQAPILALQSHLANLISANIAPIFQQQTDMILKLKVNIPTEGKLDMVVTVSSDAVSDMSDGYVDGKFVVGGTVSLQEFTELTKTDITAKLDANLLMSDSVYVTINEISIDGTSTNLETQNDIDIAKKTTTLVNTALKNTPIDIFSGDDRVDVAFLVSQLQNQTIGLNKITQDLKTKPIVTRYAKDTHTSYGFFNANVCDMISSMLALSIQQDESDLLNQCEIDLLEMKAEGNAKMLFMKDNNGTYEMGMSDMHTTNKIPSGAYQVYNNFPVVKRNTNAITEVKVPFVSQTYDYVDGKDIVTEKLQGGLLYTNQTLQVDYHDEDSKINITGPLTSTYTNLSGTLDMTGSIKGDENIHGTINLEINKKDTMSQDVKLLIGGWMGSTKIVDLDLHSIQKTTPLTTLTKKVPKNIITLQALQSLFDKLP